jgi:hypothetical protein
MTAQSVDLVGYFASHFAGSAHRQAGETRPAVRGDRHHWRCRHRCKKQALFEKVRHGVVRVLLGSTQKMGTGTNVQQRLVATRNLDVPWKPAEVEQRDGRILRCPFTHNMARLPGYASSATWPFILSVNMRS